MPRTVRTPEKRAAFLENLAKGISIGGSANLAGFGRRTAFEWRDDDPEFAADWDVAVEAGTDLYEDELRRRAMVGVDDPKYPKLDDEGNIIGYTAKRYSDTLLAMALNGRRPEKYKNHSEVTHKGRVTFKMDFGSGES